MSWLRHALHSKLPSTWLQRLVRLRLLILPAASAFWPDRPAGAAPGVYSGVADAFVKTLRNDGPLAFYNGALASTDATCTVCW